MTQRSIPVTLLALLFLPAAGAAQNLIALTRNTRSIHQGVHATCTPLGTCPTNLPIQTAAPSYWPGGTAWDGTTDSLWVTTGQRLERRSLAPCGLNCAQMACPKSSATAEAMGMDINKLTNELWILDDAGIVTRCTNSCPPVVLGSFTPVPSIALSSFTIAPTAIAIDHLNGLVFYATSDFNGSGSWIHCAQLATPAAIFQPPTPITICFGTLITGMAVHPGLGKLYITNGREVDDFTYAYNPGGPSVTFAGGVCCTLAPPGDPYIDLSIRWVPAVPLGEPCANGTCPICPMVHVLRNPPPLLGSNLQLGLDFAPPGIPVWCLLNFGSCQALGPSPAPLCGPVHVPVGGAPLATLGFVVTVGSACNASATIIQPIPLNPVYLGTPMASQFLGICPPTGTTMSNCLSWVIQ